MESVHGQSTRIRVTGVNFDQGKYFLNKDMIVAVIIILLQFKYSQIDL